MPVAFSADVLQLAVTLGGGTAAVPQMVFRVPEFAQLADAVSIGRRIEAPEHHPNSLPHDQAAEISNVIGKHDGQPRRQVLPDLDRRAAPLALGAADES